jgi:GNAT superfamily N-acetyltransferase
MKAQGYDIRLAAAADVAALPEIERQAGFRFKSHPADLGITEAMYEDSTSVETFAEAQRASRLWVAYSPAGEPVGFALVTEVAGYAHLDEIDVLPLHGSQGIGSALLAAVCSWAKEMRYPAVTLRTFRDVRWNAPFYRARGFRVVESAEVSGAHVELEASERQRGLRSDLRVTMVYETAG